MASTIRDIARITGLSLGTISNYLNGKPIKAKNQQRIQAAIDELDYQFNQAASSIKSKRSKIIGLIIPSLDLTFSIRLMVYFENFFSQQGYMLSVCVVKGQDELIDHAKLSMLLSQNVDGVIVVPPSNHVALTQWLRQHEAHLPIVILDRRLEQLEGHKHILVNNEKISLEAVEGLMNYGHRDIAIILGDQGGYTSNCRLEGYTKAHMKNNYSIDENFICYGNYTHQGGYDNMAQVMNLSKQPTALFVTNYDMTLGCIQYANENGIEIGKDIALIGFDIDDVNKLFKPNLAMVIQPLEQMAECASVAILNEINQEIMHSIDEKLVCRIDWGESVYPLKERGI